MAFQTRLPLASSEERASTPVNDPVTPNPRRSGLTRNPVLIPLWIPDQCHLVGSVTSGMTCPGAWRPANAESMDARKYCYRRYSSSLYASPPRNFRLAPKSRNNHHPTQNPRHSGLDPESSPYPVIDPGSMSHHGLGDVRDDVSWSLASSERREHGRQEILLSPILVPHSTPAHHVISGLPRNPDQAE